jgi:hypothetical protein
VSATNISAPGTVQRDTGHHCQHECDNEDRPVGRSETADRHHGSKVVQANDRMAESRKNTLSEGRRLRPPIT